MAQRVGADVCATHRCRCGKNVDPKGLHGLSCRLSAGRFPRHAAINDVVKKGLQQAGVPSTLEPVGVHRGDGKPPDGMTLFPYARGKSLVWDATVVDTYAACNLVPSAIEPGAAAQAAEIRKRVKYQALSDRFLFEPLAFETTGTCSASTRKLVKEIGQRIITETGDLRETDWLWQRLSLAIMRGNTTSVIATARDYNE